MKKTKTSLLHSGLALLLCISMLVGSTFAWFSDSISSGKNIITAGNLDLEMYWTDDLDSGKWYNVEENGHDTIFNYDNWEPGYTDVKYIKLVNAGDLALNYKLSLTPQNGVGKLAEVINVYFAEGGVAVEQRSDLQSLRAIGLLDSVLNGGATADGTLLSADQYSPLHPSGEVVMTVAMNMLTTAGNEYQNEDAGKFSITALATQAPFETDSFGSDYDSNAKYPAVLNSDSASATVNPVNGKVPAGGVALTGGNISAFVPEGVLLENGTTELTLTVTPLKNTTSDITVVNNEILIPVDVHIDGVAEGNTVPIIIELGEVLPKYLNMGNYHLYHVENGANSVMTLVADASALTAHNTFTYDPLTGEVSVAMASFSEVTMLADTAAKWDGKEDDSWYDAAKTELQIANADQLYSFAKIVGGMDADIEQDSFAGKTVKLLSDINLNHGTVVDNGIKRIFYPVGYYNTDNGVYTDKDKYDDKTNIAISSGFKTFEGTFDGNGHTISNIYQNTWEMKGDHDWYAAEDQHYRDGMGIFGRVYGGTIKNLTVDNFESDGEITTTGVIASYADFGATFENIAITNCNPRVYNIGNGGIVGCVGWYTKGETDKKVTFKNITVDNSNKISALWGSYDVPCGGIVGQYYPTSGQTSAGTPKNAGIHFENCHAAAQMDVNNDVCGNYQYYAYRYAGMLIGSVRENETIDGHVYPKMDGITAEKCTVHFGTWNDYYYCEFEKNGHPSYSGPDDYKFSRVPHSELNFTDFDSNEKINTIEERNSVTGCKHVHTAAENNQAVYLPFNNLVTGYGWGVTTKVVGDMEGVTILDREEANSVVKFEIADTAKDSYARGETVTIGELFKAKAIEDKKLTIKGDKVQVTVSPIGDDSTAGGTYTANTTDWTQGTLTFTGTGVAEIIITDYYFCKETKINVEIKDGGFLYRVGNKNAVTNEQLSMLLTSKSSDNVDVEEYIAGGSSYEDNENNIKFNDTGVVRVKIDGKAYYLEVVDAYNATTAQSTVVKDGSGNVTFANNIVLLNDCSSTGFTVSDGYAFYGNGFEIKFNGDGSYRSASLAYGFVTVENGGVLDNVQIVCKIFPQAYVFTNEMSPGSDGRYPYGYSAVVVGGNSTISNSYIYGARNNIQISNGNVTIKNTVTECGSLSNIHIKSGDGNTVVLDNVTTIQRKVTDDFGVGNTMLGFGILVGDNESTSYPTIEIKGDLRQYNWVSEEDTDSVTNDYAKQAINSAIKYQDYVHTLDEVSKINLGIVFLTTQATNIKDNRDESVKEQVPYLLSNVTLSLYKGQVYSIKKDSKVTESSRYDAEIDGIIPYAPNTQGVIVPQVMHSDVNGNSLTVNTAYDGAWITTFKADLDNITGGSYTFTFDDLVVNKNGKELAFTVRDEDGNTVNKSDSITLNQLQTSKYTLVVTDNAIYNRNGQLSDITVIHEIPFVLYATKTSIEPPKFTGIGSGVNGSIRLASSKGGNWRPAYPALEGVTVTYWSASEGQTKEIDLTTLTDKGTISGQTWTYSCDDFTLQITGGPVHTTTSYVLSPKVATRDNEKILYFAGMNKDNSTGTTARLICLEYVFTDKNASTTVGQATKYSNGIATVQYSDLPEFSWSSFQNGKVEEISSSGGGGCVTGDTLVTLADGSKKKAKDVTAADVLLVWDFYNGKYAKVPAAVMINHGEGFWDVIELVFDDGTVVNAVTAHAFFDTGLNKTVLITPENAKDFIGHSFAKASDSGCTSVKLVDCNVVNKYTDSYSLVSAIHYNFIVEDIISYTNLVPDLFAGLEVGDNMKYDEEALKADVEKYGLYTHKDFAKYITEEQFNALNGAYMKISVGKGYVTYEEIVELIINFVK